MKSWLHGDQWDFFLLISVEPELHAGINTDTLDPLTALMYL